MSAISKKTTAVAALIAGSIALVGVGTTAAFTDEVTGSFSVKIGTADLKVDPDGTSKAWAVSGDNATLKTEAAQSAGLDNLAPSSDVTVQPIPVKDPGSVPLYVTPSVVGNLEGAVSASATINGASAAWVQPGDTASVNVSLHVADVNDSYEGHADTLTVHVSGITN